MRLAYKDFAKKEELDLIHEYTLKLLKDTGVLFYCDEAIDIFKQHGARTEGHTVFIEEDMLVNALKTVPKSYEWVGRNSSVQVGGGAKTAYVTSYGPMWVLEDGKYHDPTAEDFANFAKLDQTSKVISIGNPYSMDVPFIPLADKSNYTMAATLLYVDKPIMGMCDGKKSSIEAIEMVQDFYDVHDKVVVSALINSASPLHYSQAMSEALIEYAKRGQAVFISSAAIGGMTAPDTIAATILVSNAEILAGTVLTQLINPGTPALYGIQNQGSDLRYSTGTSGSPEESLVFHAARSLSDYYGMPVRTGGLYTDSKQFDAQAGVEAFNGCYATIQSGADVMIHTTGLIASCNGISYDKYIYDEEIVESVERFVKGFEVTEKTLQFEKIVKAGPGGNFLSRTTKLYRDDFYLPKVPNRMLYGNWVAAGMPSITDVTQKIYKERIANYVLPELDKKQVEIIRRYVPEFRG